MSEQTAWGGLSGDLAASEEARQPDGRCGRYVWIVMGFPVAYLAVSFWLATLPWFMTHDGREGIYQAGYAMRLRHRDCDVVMYGDSTALTGLDPAVIRAMTGLTACNLAETSDVLGVLGTWYPLDTYLKNNRRPRILLVMEARFDFRVERPAFGSYYPEGMLVGLQNERSTGFYLGLAKRPLWVIQFAEFAGDAMVNYALGRIVPGRYRRETDTRSERADRDGFWAFPDPPQRRCLQNRQAMDDLEQRPLPFYVAGAAALRSRYGVDGTRVILDVAPGPVCDAMQDVYRRQTEGLHDNAFETLPISYFNEGDVHYSAEGSRYLSMEAARQILAVMRHGGPVQDSQKK